MLEVDTQGFSDIAMPSDVNHKVYAEFYMHPVQDHKKTIEEGRPIYQEVEYICINTPGDKNSVIRRPVRVGHHEKSDNRRFAAQYRQFKENKEQVLEGTPLKEWPLISQSQVLELEHYNIKTVEQLSELSDSHAQKLMGYNKLRTQAASYLAAAKGDAPTAQMQEELNKAKEEADAMKEQMAEMMRELKALKADRPVMTSSLDEEQEKPKRGPGRPPKE